MKRTKITIATLAATLALTSCQQTYNCHCVQYPDAQPITNQRLDYEITASSQNQATNECNAEDNQYKDCTLQ
jgi:hypothetical protein